MNGRGVVLFLIAIGFLSNLVGLIYFLATGYPGWVLAASALSLVVLFLWFISVMSSEPGAGPSEEVRTRGLQGFGCWIALLILIIALLRNP